jgi:hypothetical protein
MHNMVTCVAYVRAHASLWKTCRGCMTPLGASVCFAFTTGNLVTEQNGHSLVLFQSKRAVVRLACSSHISSINTINRDQAQKPKNVEKSSYVYSRLKKLTGRNCRETGTVAE